MEHQADVQRASDASPSLNARPRHQPELDGIRGLAILAVLLTHASAVISVVPDIGAWHWLLFFTTPLWGGVDLFFALSGFLITGILIRGLKKPGYFKSFYIRRALRIFPVYYLFLIVSLLLCTKFPPIANQISNSAAALPDSIRSKLSYFFYLQNIPVFWPAITTGLTGLWGAYWSLAVEEQFYLVWPTLVRWVQLRWLYVGCIVMLFLCPSLRFVLAEHVTGYSLGLLQFPVARLDGLFAGAALAFYTHLNAKALPMRWAVTWLSVGVAILIYIGVARPSEFMMTGPVIDVVGVSGFALAGLGLIAASQNNTHRLKRALSTPILTTLGKYSYGIYVYHLTIFFIARGHREQWIGSRLIHPLRGCALESGAILCSILIAIFSYHFFESPFLALKAHFPSAADSSRMQITS